MAAPGSLSSPDDLSTEIDMSTALSLCRTRSEDSAGSDQFARGADHQLDSAYDEFLPNLYTNQRGPSEPPILTDVPPALIQELGRILPRALRDEVVVLYFRHVHPLCPIVDEFEFARIYRECEREEDLFSRFDVMLFLAMMFVAFAVSIIPSQAGLTQALEVAISFSQWNSTWEIQHWR